MEEHVEPAVGTPHPQLPVSAGIPPVVVASVIVVVCLVFVILALVFTNSGFGHAWPSSTSTSIQI